jgi:hypothetical protein
VSRIIGVAFAVALAANTASAGDRIAVAWDEGPTGRVRLLSGADPWPFLSSAVTTGPRPVVRTAFGKVFVISAPARTVTVVDVGTWTISGVLSLPGTTEMRDIAVVSSSLAYVTDGGSAELLRLDLGTGQATPATDMSVLDCGFPDRMAIHDGRMFVQLGQEVAPPGEHGACLAVVDIATEQLVDAIPYTGAIDPILLVGTRPKLKMQVIPANPAGGADVDRLFVGATGVEFDFGGLEVVDIDNLTSLGYVLPESDDTAVDLGPFVMETIDSGFLSCTTDFDVSSHPAMFAPGKFMSLGYAAVGYSSPRLLLAGGYFFFPDGGSHVPGVTIFDAKSGVLLSKVPTGGHDPTDMELVP